MDVQCPVCLELFPSEDPLLQFPLHLITCNTPVKQTFQSSDTTSTYQEIVPAQNHTPGSCPICCMVYYPTSLAHEIEFHEEECIRINGNIKINSKKRRQQAKDHEEPGNENRQGFTEIAIEKRKPELKCASLCQICGTGGRQLIPCTGICARSFHASCIGESSLTQRQNADQKQIWKCGECTRHIHSCAGCGMIGDDSFDIFRCSLTGCGYFFHKECSTKPIESSQSFICPRHTCTVCLQPNLDYDSSIFCFYCHRMHHNACWEGENAFVPIAANFGYCKEHVEVGARPKGLTESFQMKFKSNDVILVLEMGSSILTPDCNYLNTNQYGRVASLEQGVHGTQLLNVELFLNGSIITITNHHALRILNAPEQNAQTIINCLSIHAQCELWIRNLAVNADANEIQNALTDTVLAFGYIIKSLNISQLQAMEQVNRGYNIWKYDKAKGKTSSLLFSRLDAMRRYAPRSLKEYSKTTAESPTLKADPTENSERGEHNKNNASSTSKSANSEKAVHTPSATIDVIDLTDSVDDCNQPQATTTNGTCWKCTKK